MIHAGCNLTGSNIEQYTNFEEIRYANQQSNLGGKGRGELLATAKS